MSAHLRLLLAIFATAWFAVIMPAHQRGQIRLPGLPQEGVGSCCSVRSEGHCGDEQREDDGRDDPVRSCAVCHLVAKLSPPIVLIVPLPEPQPVAELTISTPADPECAADLRPQRSRAPPVHI